MAFGLGEALLSWLVESAADAVVRLVRGDPTEQAMRELVSAAVEAELGEYARDLDEKQLKHLRSVFREGHLTLEWEDRAGLCKAMHVWTATLDREEFNEPGYLTRLGIGAQQLAENLTDRIVDGIKRGGPLNDLAEWLWRDKLEAKVDEIQRNLARPPPAEPPVPTGLRGCVADFTGRHQQLALLAERIQEHDPAGMVVAIHAVAGMAGVGKTELALQVAHQHRARYPDGQYFLDLHGYTEDIPPVAPAAGLKELLRQAGLTEAEVPTDLAGRQARWQTLMARKRALVLLDNAADAKQVRPMLPGSAGCLVLVTSRTRLADLPGVRSLPLDVLPADEAMQLFCRIAGDNGANPDPEIAAKVVEIVGWLPVAIRAVAAQVGADYSVAELATDLAEAKQQLVLTGAAGPLGAGVAAAFDTSAQRLDPPHQQAYQILGIYPGPTIGMPQFAALAGLPIPQAFTTLRTLAARNLLAPADRQIGHRRWRQHDLLRDHSRRHASIHLSTQRQSSALAQFTTWYASALALAEHALVNTSDTVAPVVEGLHFDRPDHARAWLNAEQDNLLAYARQASGEAAADVCHRYARRLYLMERRVAPQALFGTAAGIYRQIGDRTREAHALVGLGAVAIALQDYPAAHGHLQAAADLCRESGDRTGHAYALVGLGVVAIALREFPAARDHLQAAAEIWREIGDRAGHADALVGLGEAAKALGEYPAYPDYFQMAAEIVQVGDWTRRARGLVGLGLVAIALREFPAARDRFQAAADLCRESGDRPGQALARIPSGQDAQAAGRQDEALVGWREAQAIVDARSPLAE